MLDGYPLSDYHSVHRKCRPRSHSNHCHHLDCGGQLTRPRRLFGLDNGFFCEGVSLYFLRQYLRVLLLLLSGNVCKVTPYYTSLNRLAVLNFFSTRKWPLNGIIFNMTVEAHWIYNQCLHKCNLCLPIIEKTRSEWHQIPTAVLRFKSQFNTHTKGRGQRILARVCLRSNRAAAAAMFCVFPRRAGPWRWPFRPLLQ